jgi:Spy/CpxP family protein refolding chaperone
MNTKPLLSTMEGDLKKWRAGGRSEKTYLLVFALAILAIVLLGIKVASSAPFPQAGQNQGWHHGPGPMGPEQELGWLSDKLKLTPDQKSKIQPILEEEHKQLSALHADTSLAREEKQAKFKQIRSSAYDQINPILTEQQQATLKQLQQHQQGMKARHQNGSDESAAPQSQ